MAKSAVPFALKEPRKPGELAPAAVAPSTVTSPAGGGERQATIAARVPWSLAQKLKAYALQQSQAQGRRVTAQEVVEKLVADLVANK